MKRDLESHEIFDKVREMSSKDHSESDAFVCCILAHGSENAVYGIDRKEIQIRDVINLFKGTHCKSLAGKPKLFFVQACQGDDDHIMVRSQRDYVADGIKYVPNEADMLLALSTMPGYYSYRNEILGSWFIQSFAKHFAENYKNTHLLDILTLVSCDVSERGQMPLVISTLRKHLYF
ncbi:caspase-3-like [Saccostrea cucullata]|uniref:caspase-3-like n=1 Tax=Saccostrea cuccullata TaxID=36930 RepID=UPI002ECFE7AD